MFSDFGRWWLNDCLPSFFLIRYKDLAITRRTMSVLVSVSCCVSWPLSVSVCDPQQVMDTDQQVADSSTQGSLGLDLWATFNTEGEAGHKYHPGLIQTIIMCRPCGLWSLSNEKPPVYSFLCGLPQLLSVSDSESRKSDWLRDWQMALCQYKCNLMSHDSGAWWSQPAAGDLWPGSGRHKEV